MISNILWVICLTLLLTGFLSGLASAAYVLGVELDKAEIDAGGQFDVKLTLNNTGSQNLTNAKVEIGIYVDGVLVHEDVESGIDLPENSSKTIATISSSRFMTSEAGNVWEKALTGYECGRKTLEVKLTGGVSASNEVNIEVKGKKLYVGVKPTAPTPGSEIVVEVEDDNSDPLDNVDVRITNLGDDEKWDVDDVSREDSTDNGKVTFKPLDEDFRFKDNPYGIYQVDVWDKNYCLFRDKLEVVNKLRITEVPDRVYAGEEIKVKVLDINDNRVENAGIAVSGTGGLVGSYKSDSTGYAIFTINNAGSYTVIASKSGYENSDILTLNVQTRKGMDIRIEPTKQAVGEEVTITVESGGNPIEDAEVEIMKPDGKKDVLSTSSAGKLLYRTTLTGTYDVTVKKTAYETTTSSFKAMNFFNITLPDKLELHKETAIIVNNQAGVAVEDASVEITGAGITGLTDSAGNFMFILEEAGDYTLAIKKEGYEDFSYEMNIRGGLSLKINPGVLDIGDTVNMEVFDDNGEKIRVTLRITKPDGEQETFEASSHTLVPEQAGRYNITASKEYYVTASSGFDVNPYPLDLDVRFSGNDLAIKATSRGAAARNVSISILTPDGEEFPLTTDASGMAKLNLEGLNRTGTFTVSSVDVNYERKTVRTDVKQGSSLMPILLFSAASILIFLLLGLTFYISHRKSQGTTLTERYKRTDRKRGSGLRGI